MDRREEITNLITHIALNTEGITTEQIEKANEKYKDDSRNIKDIESELIEYSKEISEKYKRNSIEEVEPVDNVDSSTMINNISQTLERQDIINDIRDMSNYLLENGKGNSSINMISNVIGNIFLYHIIHKDSYGFDSYYNSLIELYKKGLKKDDFENEKAKLIMDSIKKRLNITSSNMSSEENKRVSDYFLTQYVENGYVAHSFPTSSFQSIRENGLSAKRRNWEKDETKEISNIFISHNVPGAFGGYPYYNGEGIYYEHNMEMVYKHGLYSPEWLTVFTSADHYMDLNDISKNPYIFRTDNKKDKANQACIQNVEDLISNADLSSEEKSKVRKYFDKQWELLSNPGGNVALIPKKKVNKDGKEKASSGATNALDVIKNSLTDKNNQFEEHTGNVYKEEIPYNELVIIRLPNVRKYIDIEKIEFKRETEKELKDETRNRKFMEHISEQKQKMNNEQANIKIDRIGDDNTVPRNVRIERLKNIRSQVINKTQKKNEMNGMFKQNQTNMVQQHQNTQTPKVYTKSNPSSNNKGYADSLLIIAISIMTLITSILLYLVK